MYSNATNGGSSGWRRIESHDGNAGCDAESSGDGWDDDADGHNCLYRTAEATADGAGDVSTRDGAAIGTGSVGGNTASYSTTCDYGDGIAHGSMRVYAGDANYNGDTSNTVSTSASSSSTTTTITATPLAVASGMTDAVDGDGDAVGDGGWAAAFGECDFYLRRWQGVLGVAGLNGSTRDADAYADERPGRRRLRRRTAATRGIARARRRQRRV